MAEEEPRLGSTLSCLLSEGKRAKSCIANVTVANTCNEEGRRDAKQTDAKIEAFSEVDLETLSKDFNSLLSNSSVLI